MISVIDIVSLAILTLFILSGIFRGLKLTTLWLVSLILSYVAAIVAPMFLTGFVAKHFGLPRIAAAIQTAFTSMFIVTAIFAMMRRKIRREQKSEVKAEKIIKSGKPVISIKNRICGGLMGFVSGLVVLAFVAWVYDAASATPLGRFIPDASTSPAARLSESIMRGAFTVGTVIATQDAGVAGFAGAVLSRPSRTVAGVNKLLANSEIKQLAHNPAFLGAFYAGDEAALTKTPGLARFLNNMDNKKLLLSMGVLPKGGVVEIPKGLAKAGKMLAGLVSNAGLTGTLQGLQKDGLFEEGKALQLVLDPRFQSLVGSLLDDGSSPAVPVPAKK